MRALVTDPPPDPGTPDPGPQDPPPPTNHQPIATNDSATTPQNTAVTVNVLSNDSDPDGDALAITSVGTPANGTAAVSGSGVRYTPTAGYSGPDDFTYAVSDGHGGSASANVHVTGILNPARRSRQ